MKQLTEIIDEIKNQILFITDDDIFIMGKDYMKFKFKTDDKFPYNEKINIAVCAISINSVFEQGSWYYPQINLQERFYGNENYE